MHQEAEEEEAEDEGADEEEVLVLGWHQGAEGGDEACVGFCQVCFLDEGSTMNRGWEACKQVMLGGGGVQEQTVPGIW